MSDNAIPLLCIGFAVTLAGLFMLDRRLAKLNSLPRDVLAVVNRERQRAQTEALNHLTERVALKAGEAIYAIVDYQNRLAQRVHERGVQAEAHAITAERRGFEAGTALSTGSKEALEALARVPPLLLDLEALARELRANRATRPEGRRTTPMLPPSMPPPAQLGDQEPEAAESERKTIETPAPAGGFDDDDERTKLVESEELRALRKQSAQLAQTNGDAR